MRERAQGDSAKHKSLEGSLSVLVLEELRRTGTTRVAQSRRRSFGTAWIRIGRLQVIHVLLVNCHNDVTVSDVATARTDNRFDLDSVID